MNAPSAPALASGTLWIHHGQENISISQFLQHNTQDITAPLFYLEPALQLNSDNSAGRLKNFTPLTKTLPQEIPSLEAAYVFGTQQGQPIGIQLIASDEGCRWFRYSEQEQDESVAQAINKRCYQVLTRRDFKRFFGNKQYSKQLDSKLTVTEYWHETGLLCWWITTGDKK